MVHSSGVVSGMVRAPSVPVRPVTGVHPSDGPSLTWGSGGLPAKPCDLGLQASNRLVSLVQLVALDPQARALPLDLGVLPPDDAALPVNQGEEFSDFGVLGRVEGPKFLLTAGGEAAATHWRLLLLCQGECPWR